MWMERGEEVLNKESGYDLECYPTPPKTIIRSWNRRLSPRCRVRDPHQPVRNPTPSRLAVDRQLIQKRPTTPLLPALRLPPGHISVREECAHVPQAAVVGQAHQHIVTRVEVFQFGHALPPHFRIQKPSVLGTGDGVKRCGARVRWGLVAIHEDGAGAWGGEVCV